MNNHYHTEGYIKDASMLGEMMRKLHGSVAKLVMKGTGVHWVPFWRERGKRNYFDGCLRDVLQGVRTYRYVLMQAVRAGIVQDYREYSDTRINIEMDRAIARAVQLKAFMERVPYARYDSWKTRRNRDQRS